MFSSVVALQEKALREKEDIEPGTYAKIARSVADLARASVQQKKFLREVREKAASVADDAETLMQRGGLSDDAVREIKQKILEIGESNG